MTLKLNRWGHALSRADLSVVLSTYNQPEWLEKVLLGYAQQSFRNFEVLIADDGSDDRTPALLARLAPALPYSLLHVWQPDEGFRKCTILNRAIELAQADYLVFSDGDCVPRRDFLSVHAALRAPNRFLSGGYCKLPMPTSKSIDNDCIERGDFAHPAWLSRHGCEDSALTRKLRVHGHWAQFWDWLSTAKASWNGHNASAWRSDIDAVNGFDERMQYGGEDREFGERLVNNGVKGIRIRYRAIVVHLDHARGYATAESIARNRIIRAQTRRQRSVWAEQGMRAGPAPATVILPQRA